MDAMKVGNRIFSSLHAAPPPQPESLRSKQANKLKRNNNRNSILGHVVADETDSEAIDDVETASDVDQDEVDEETGTEEESTEHMKHEDDRDEEGDERNTAGEVAQRKGEEDKDRNEDDSWCR